MVISGGVWVAAKLKVYGTDPEDTQKLYVLKMISIVKLKVIQNAYNIYYSVKKSTKWISRGEAECQAERPESDEVSLCAPLRGELLRWICEPQINSGEGELCACYVSWSWEGRWVHHKNGMELEGLSCAQAKRTQIHLHYQSKPTKGLAVMIWFECRCAQTLNQWTTPSWRH